jgi:hypothetical protein
MRLVAVLACVALAGGCQGGGPRAETGSGAVPLQPPAAGASYAGPLTTSSGPCGSTLANVTAVVSGATVRGVLNPGSQRFEGTLQGDSFSTTFVAPSGMVFDVNGRLAADGRTMEANLATVRCGWAATLRRTS